MDYTVHGILQARILEWVAIPFSCDPIDSSPPGSPIHGIFQARVLEWVAIAFSDLTLKWSKINELSFMLIYIIEISQS